MHFIKLLFDTLLLILTINLAFEFIMIKHLTKIIIIIFNISTWLLLTNFIKIIFLINYYNLQKFFNLVKDFYETIKTCMLTIKNFEFNNIIEIDYLAKSIYFLLKQLKKLGVIGILFAIITTYIAYLNMDYRVTYSIDNLNTPKYNEDMTKENYSFKALNNNIYEKNTNLELSEVSISFTNQGNNFLEENDFIKPFTILFPSKIKIYGYMFEEIYYNRMFFDYFAEGFNHENFEPLNLNIEVENNKMMLKPKLLNPGDSISFIIFTDKMTSDDENLIRIYAHIKKIKKLQNYDDDFINKTISFGMNLFFKIKLFIINIQFFLYFISFYYFLLLIKKIKFFYKRD